MTSPTISEHTRKLNDKMDDVFNMIAEDIKSQQELDAALLKMSHALSRVVKSSEERNKAIGTLVKVYYGKDIN